MCNLIKLDAKETVDYNSLAAPTLTRAIEIKLNTFAQTANANQLNYRFVIKSARSINREKLQLRESFKC